MKKTGIGRIFQNFSSLLTGKMAGDAFTFLFFVVISRTYGQEGIGKYSFAIALSGFFVVFADFGLGSLSIRDMSRITGSLSRYFGQILCVRVFLTVSVLAVMFVLMPLFSFSRETVVIITVISINQLIYALVDGFASVFISRQEMHYVGLMELSLRMFSALAAIAVTLLGYGLVPTLCALPVVSVIHLAAVYRIVTRKYGRPQMIWNVSDIRQKLSHAVPYWFSMLLNQLNTRLDVLFLGFLLTASAAGVYNVGYRIVFLLLFVPRFMGTTLFPIVSKLFVDSQEKLKEAYTQSLNYACLIGLPAAAGLWLIAPELIEMIFGKDFAESAMVLRYLAWILFLTFFRSIMGVFLTSCDRQNARTGSQLIAACSNIAGNAVLIYLLGIRGAAIATLFSETLLVVLFAVRLRDMLGWPRIWSRLMKGGVATVAFVVPLVLYGELSLFAVIALAVFIYTGTLLLFPAIRKNEFRMLVGFIKNNIKKEVATT